jgi:hypothetical protein
MAKRPQRHGYAAFAPADVADARRGRPAADLAGYAGSRGLEWLDRASAAGFNAAFPGFEAYRYNVARGVLPGGRFGALLHQLLEVPVTGRPNISGSLYGSVVKTPGRWWTPRLPNRTDIPILGDFLDPPDKPGDPEPFESHAVWIPTTTVTVNVPEAALPLFLLRIDRRDRHSPFDFEHKRDLASLGAPGWRLRAHGQVPSDELLGRLLSPAVRALLERRVADPFFQLLLLRGTLVVRANGYVADPGALDALATDACAVADAARDACLPELSPRAFAEPLPAPHASHPEVTPPWRDAYLQLAARLRLTPEDADDYHRAFPSLGVPGRTVAVMRGDLDGAPGRLVYSAERNLRAAERARGAVLLSAPPGAEPTPPGGARHPDHALVHEQRDGVTVLWSMRTAGLYREEQEDLIARAVRFARERALVAG